MSSPPSPPPDAAGRALLAALELPAAVQAAALQCLHAGLDAPLTEERQPAAGWRLHPDGAGGWLLLEAGPAGARPWAAGDRFGALHLAAPWEGRALRDAWLRLPLDAWLEVRPGAGEHALWGASDVLVHHAGAPQPAGGQAVGLLPAQDYAALDALPPFDRPAALPPGAGSAMLNFLARLLALQGRSDAAYHGPYPTAALFASLCRSFVPVGADGADGAALEALFTRDETALAFRGAMAPNPVRWRPAPFAPARPAPHLLLHLREGAQQAWVRDVLFRRAEAAGGALPGGERVWSERSAEGARYAVGLALLGRPYCRFFRLDERGAVRQGTPPHELDAAAAEGSPPPVALHPQWGEVLFAWATLRANAGLAAAVQRLEADVSPAWAPLPLRMAALRDDALLVQAALPEAFRQRRAGDEDAAALAMMLVSDVLEAATPHLLRRAQQRLAEAPRPNLASLLAAGEAAQDAARTRLDGALPALVRDLAHGAALPPDAAG